MAGIFFKPLAHPVGHQAFQRLAHFGRDQLVLGLRREFWIRQFHRHNRGQAFAHVIARQRDLFLFQHARFFGVVVQRARQCRAECRQVGAAIALRNVVGEA